MRFFRGQITTIADEMVKALIAANFVEVTTESQAEAVLDIEAVLKEYLRMQRDVNEKAKDAVASRNLDYSQLSKVRQEEAARRGMSAPEDWLLKQLVESMLHSKNVDEVFGQDHELRRVMRDVLKRYADTEKELDRQVRARIKNLQEGTTNWEIEYQRVMGDLKEQKRLD